MRAGMATLIAISVVFIVATAGTVYPVQNMSSNAGKSTTLAYLTTINAIWYYFYNNSYFTSVSPNLCTGTSTNPCAFARQHGVAHFDFGWTEPKGWHGSYICIQNSERNQYNSTYSDPHVWYEAATFWDGYPVANEGSTILYPGGGPTYWFQAVLDAPATWVASYPNAATITLDMIFAQYPSSPWCETLYA